MTSLEAGPLWDLVERRAAATPEAVFGVDEDGRTMTFAEYRDAALRAAAGLAAEGVGADVAVSWQLPTWFESMILVAALARLGAVQNPMLPIYREREVRFIAGQTGARLLVVPSTWKGFDYEGLAREVAADQPGLSVLVVDRTLPAGDPSTLPAAPDPAADPVRWVFYTSGTTADPKGARHTDRTIAASAVAMVQAYEITDADRSALVFPFTHIGGIGWLFAALVTGCRAIVIEAFNPDTTIPVLQREGVTLAGAGTFFHLAYLGAQRAQPGRPLFPEARAYPGGGAAKPPQLHYEVKAELGGVGVVSGYGLTECPILSISTVHDSDEQLATTEGPLSPGVAVKVVALDGSIAGPGEEGEIRVKGPQLFKGYLDSSLDREAFDDDGYFRTGDLGTLDADRHVAITGRLKDVIIRKGETISAKEIEDLLFTHPKVADAAVIGVPDPVSGERACALVVAADPGDAPTLRELTEFLSGAGLMTQKLPEQLEILDGLPRNPAGKVLKHELRTQYGG